MIYESKEYKTRTGLAVTLKSAGADEARLLIDYLKRVCGETPFLLREPEDVTFTADGEREFIAGCSASADSLMLNAYVGGELIGSASFMPAGTARAAHRCTLGMAVFLEYSGRGIGELLINVLTEQAKRCGYEIMELEVAASNTHAVHLYEKLGFTEYGRRKKSLKYKNGTYADEILMAREL